MKNLIVINYLNFRIHHRSHYNHQRYYPNTNFNITHKSTVGSFAQNSKSNCSFNGNEVSRSQDSKGIQDTHNFTYTKHNLVNRNTTFPSKESLTLNNSASTHYSSHNNTSFKNPNTVQTNSYVQNRDNSCNEHTNFVNSQSDTSPNLTQNNWPVHKDMCSVESSQKYSHLDSVANLKQNRSYHVQSPGNSEDHFTSVNLKPEASSNFTNSQKVESNFPVSEEIDSTNQLRKYLLSYVMKNSNSQSNKSHTSEENRQSFDSFNTPREIRGRGEYLNPPEQREPEVMAQNSLYTLENLDQIYYSDSEDVCGVNVPKNIRENLRQLISQYPEGVWCKNLYELYK